jgi:hypothetical protein
MRLSEAVASEQAGLCRSLLGSGHRLSDLGCVSLYSRRLSYPVVPSLLYPAASAYQLAKGCIHFFNQGRLRIYGARDGALMAAEGGLGGIWTGKVLSCAVWELLRCRCRRSRKEAWRSETLSSRASKSMRQVSLPVRWDDVEA